MKREARREGRRKAEGAEREGEMEERGWSLSIFTPQLCRLLVPGVNSAFYVQLYSPKVAMKIIISRTIKNV